jgi:hypothetical protein
LVQQNPITGVAQGPASGRLVDGQVGSLAIASEACSSEALYIEKSREGFGESDSAFDAT